MISAFSFGLIVLPLFLFVLLKWMNKYIHRIKWLLIFLKLNPRSVLYMKPVRVELDGKSRPLKFDFNAMADFEELMGMGIGVAFADGQVGFRTIRALFWAGLRHKDRGLTLERTGQMLSKEVEEGRDIDDLMGVIEKAIESSGIMPKAEEEEDEEDIEDGEAKNE